MNRTGRIDARENLSKGLKSRLGDQLEEIAVFALVCRRHLLHGSRQLLVRFYSGVNPPSAPWRGVSVMNGAPAGKIKQRKRPGIKVYGSESLDDSMNYERACLA